MVKKIPVPPRDFISSPRLIVIRSFDVNKPGSEVEELKGGVAGGSITRGVLKVSENLSFLFIGIRLVLASRFVLVLSTKMLMVT